MIKKNSHLAIIVGGAITVALLFAFFVPLQWHQTRTVPFLFAASVGPNNPGTGTEGTTASCSDNMNWSFSAGDLAANDTTYSSYTGGNWDLNDVTDAMQSSNFGFSVSGTIDGVVVEIIAFTGAGGGVYHTAQLISAPGPTPTTLGTNQADNLTALPTSDPSSTYKSFGGATNTWGATLTDTIVNDAGFGYYSCFRATSNNSTIFYDHVRMTVHYTATIASQVIQQAEFWFD